MKPHCRLQIADWEEIEIGSSYRQNLPLEAAVQIADCGLANVMEFIFGKLTNPELAFISN